MTGIDGGRCRRGDAYRRPVRMGQGFPNPPRAAAEVAVGRVWRTGDTHNGRTTHDTRHETSLGMHLARSEKCFTAEPEACTKRGGTTPNHPEPGRETPQRRRYWRLNRWETRSVRPQQ